MNHNTPNNPSDADRLLDLLTLQASVGLDDADQQELDRLLRGQDEFVSGEFEAAASATAELFTTIDYEPMPAYLRERCIGSARAVLHDDDETAAPEPLKITEPKLSVQTQSAGGGSSWASSMGWLAAAACLMIAVLGWLPSPAPMNTIPSDPLINFTGDQPLLASQRDEFIKSHADVIICDWAKWGDKYAAVTGDVVFDSETNEGYMRFRNLPENDPDVCRYQLWIVDQARGTPLKVPPVDGGMFDVAQPTDGEWIVHFRARLPVGDAYGFGVTVEGPDGVVVSEQGEKAVIALAPSRQS